jgi:two-component system sensor histidine kinase KdpD
LVPSAEAERGRSESCALIEHEIRNASTVIGGYLRLLEQGRAGPPGATMREFLRLAMREVTRIERLADQLLDLAEGSAPELCRVRKLERIGEVVTAAVASYAPLAAERGIRLEIEPDTEDPLLPLDRERIEELVRNLLANAANASPPGARVRVAIELVEGSQGAFVQVSVVDEGPGIPSEDAESIFEPFVRLPGERSGRGLGLALCRRVAEAHGGTIRAETEGPGGHVRLTLPLGSRA